MNFSRRGATCFPREQRSLFDWLKTSAEPSFDSLFKDFIYPRNLMVAGAGFEPATFGL